MPLFGEDVSASTPVLNKSWVLVIAITLVVLVPKPSCGTKSSGWRLTVESVSPAVGSAQRCMLLSAFPHQWLVPWGWWELKLRVMCKSCWRRFAAFSHAKEAACFVLYLGFVENNYHLVNVLLECLVKEMLSVVVEDLLKRGVALKWWKEWK